MAIITKTNAPADLLAAIKKEIDEEKIETCTYDANGDFTHTPEQGKYYAWLRSKIYVGELRFGIVKNKDINMSTIIYGVYHG